MKRLLLVAALLASLGIVAVAEPDPAAAKTPFPKPFMGWSSWSVQSSTRSGYGKNWLTETNIRNAANAMASKLKSAGYTYINIDAGWNADFNWSFHTDANGIPNPDPGRFPNGIASLASYVHGLGLKLGLYGAAGLEKEVYNKNAPILGTSCRAHDIVVRPLTPTNMWGGNWKIDYGKPCAQSYIDSIVARYASWGVDFIKIDGVTEDNVPDIRAWSTAIDRSGRAMWLTASAWPVPIGAADGLRPWANGVRIDTDVECYCNTVATWTNSVDNRWNDLPNWLPKVSAPDYLPDLDSMPISNNTGSGIQDGINDVERQSVMTFWSMASAPLYVGGDIYFLDNKAVSILTNPEVIAVNQAAVLPSRVRSGTTQVWKKVVGSVTYVAVYNLGSSTTDITVQWGELGISGSAAVRDVVSRTDLGTFNGSWRAAAVPAHGSRLIKLTGVSGGPTGYTWCANENGTCSFSGTASVGYGANGTFTYRTATGSTACNNATFGDPLPGVVKACYYRSSSYEAEAGSRGGGAVVAGCSACSGGQKVGYLGNGSGAVTLTVHAPTSGSRNVTIHFLVNGTRTFQVSVNGASATALTLSGSSWSTPISTTVALPLNAGDNTIRFFNNNAWAPDLDRVVVL